MKKRVRLVLGLLLIALTIIVFARYLSEHMNLVRELRRVPLATALWLFILYGAWLGALAFILHVSLYICKRVISVEENILMNAYSTLTNFFIPGQGGIALRGVYLKKTHNLRVRDYISVMLLYYACYALVSTFMLLMPSRPWWQTVGGMILMGAAVAIGTRWYMGRTQTNKDKLDIRAKSIMYLFAATVVQAVVQVAIYAVELHGVNHRITLGQVVTYTGAANFALFAALTPGAIGIRESFLVFSQSLHHISTANIVAASIIDRGIFLVFLGFLFVLTLSMHAKNKLQLAATLKKQSGLRPSAVSDRRG